jgi:hypothetical protein
MTKLDAQALYVQLGRLLESMPDLMENYDSPSAIQWLARAHALVREAGFEKEAETITSRASSFTNPYSRKDSIYHISSILYRVLAIAELQAPTAAQGAFIPAGNAFDALAVIGKVLSAAKRDLLIVDPYMDEKVLTDFVGLAAENVGLRLLADQQGLKPTLRSAVQRWQSQYGSKRPLLTKLASPRSLHDRLIIVDGTDVWDLTQSLNAFAARSPATIVRSSPEQAELKIPYYESVWTSAVPL